MEDQFFTWGLLLVAAFLGGGLNAVAGGGSFFTLPALIYIGIPPVAANATGTLALLPGYFASTWGFREDLSAPKDLSLGSVVAVSGIGGSLGALFLIFTPDDLFSEIIPWLLLLATILFAIGPRLLYMFGSSEGEAKALPHVVSIFFACVYGGYFNGGLGIVLLTTFSLLGHTHLNAMQGLKNLVSSVLTAVAVIFYMIGGAIAWKEAIVMMIAAILGGYVMARVARKLPPSLIRAVVIATGAAMTYLFF